MVEQIRSDAPVLVIGLGRFGAACAGELDRLERDEAEALTALRDTLIDLAERCQGDERPDCPIIAELAAARSA